MVSKELLDEFKMIYKEEFNVVISDEEATEMSTELVNLMKVLLKPDPEPEPENTSQFKEGEEDETGRLLSK